MATLLHVTSRLEWQEAQARGQYRAASLAAQGFIHCSTPAQVVGVANSLFRGRTDLVVLCIDSDKVGSEIRYENPEGSQESFPHVYGPITLDSVVNVLPFEPNAAGLFELPEAFNA